MKNLIAIISLTLVILAGGHSTDAFATADIDSLPLFNQAKAAYPDRYQFAVEKGARFIPTSDGRSFYILWTPAGFSTATNRSIIVTLHGHGSWAFDEFYLWYEYAAQRGYGIMALQWWFGGGENTTDYYLPQDIYPIFEQEIDNQSITPGNVLMHGFSRGSANSYAVTALDRQRRKFFGLTIANAGGMASDFPPNVSIINGDFGAMPFQDSHWVMYCGANDPNPNRDGCVAMRAARDLVTRYGGEVDLLIEDPTGDHGGFHRNAANVNSALDVFDALTNRCKITITGLTLAGTQKVRTPITFTATAQNSCATNSIYYRFSYHGGYGTSAYDGRHWVSMTTSEYQTGNSCSYSFDSPGKYIVVVWGVTDPSDVDTVAVSIAGLSVEIVEDTSACITRINEITVTGEQKVNNQITITSRAQYSCSNQLYYRFSCHGGYGTSAYDGSHWTVMTNPEYRNSNMCTYTFNTPGKYIVTVWALKDLNNIDTSSIPIIGLSLDIAQ